MMGFEPLQYVVKKIVGDSGEDSRERLRTQETRQVYRIVEEEIHAVKVEAYEVEITTNRDTGEVYTEVQKYLWGNWFEKSKIVDWPDPLAQAYVEAKIDSSQLDDFWVL